MEDEIVSMSLMLTRTQMRLMASCVNVGLDRIYAMRTGEHTFEDIHQVEEALSDMVAAGEDFNPAEDDDTSLEGDAEPMSDEDEGILDEAIAAGAPHKSLLAGDMEESTAGWVLPDKT